MVAAASASKWFWITAKHMWRPCIKYSNVWLRRHHGIMGHSMAIVVICILHYAADIGFSRPLALIHFAISTGEICVCARTEWKCSDEPIVKSTSTRPHADTGQMVDFMRAQCAHNVIRKRQFVDKQPVDSYECEITMPLAHSTFVVRIRNSLLNELVNIVQQQKWQILCPPLPSSSILQLKIVFKICRSTNAAHWLASIKFNEIEMRMLVASSRYRHGWLSSTSNICTLDEYSFVSK